MAFASSYPAGMILFSEKDAAPGILHRSRGRGKALHELAATAAA